MDCKALCEGSEACQQGDEEVTIKNGDMPAMHITSEQAQDADMWGMSKREMMAMHMMAHLMPDQNFESYAAQATSAVLAADALLAELDRTK